MNDLSLPDAYITPQGRRGSNVYMGLTKDTWVIVIGIVVLLAFSIAAVVVSDQIKRDVESTPSALSESGLNEQMLDYLIKNSANEDCVSSLTINPVAVCESLCDKEFCSGDPSCPGKCKPLTSVTLQSCKAGCLCCGVYHDCLLRNQNNVQYCQEQLSDCKFGDPGIPIEHPANVCLASLSQNYCFQVGVGFNTPVTCTS